MGAARSRGRSAEYGLAFLLPLHGRQSILAATSELALIAYALPSVSLIAFRRVERPPARDVPAGGAPVGGGGRGMTVLAPAAFVLASMILYWATWKELRIALPVLLVGAVVYGNPAVPQGSRLAGRPGRARLPRRDLDPARADPDADDALDDFGAAPAG